jgi:hypothetical protein
MNPNPAPAVAKSADEWRNNLRRSSSTSPGGVAQSAPSQAHSIARGVRASSMRLLRRFAVHVEHQVRFRHRLAQLLGTGRQRSGERTRGGLVADAPDRGPLRIMRRASRSCLSRWPQTDGSTLVHERRRVELCAERNVGQVIAVQPGFGGGQDASAVGRAAYELLSMCARNSAIEPKRTVPLGSSASIDPSA